MKKPATIALIIISSLLAYVIFTVMFSWLFQYTTSQPLPDTPTIAPTFTPTAEPTAVVLVNTATSPPPPMTPTPISTETPSPVPPATATILPTATASPKPQISAATTVNIRSGPGTNYPVVGKLPPGQLLPIIGKNEAGTWWQVPLPDASTGWIAASVVNADGPFDIPVVSAPPPPVPPTPIPDTPSPAPQFQYEPTGWYGDTNYGLTRFLGSITDAAGNPVNGVSVEAQCGDFRIISNPSGPVGWPPFFDSAGDPPGFYDITLDTKPIPCAWFLTVVESPDGKGVTARLSDAIEVETTVDSSIVTANWRKNW
jgi:hypothetical protein